MPITILQLLGLLAALLVWKLFRRFVLSHPLDRIPGPACQSLLTGNVYQLFCPDAWDFHRSLAETYGRVCRVFGPFKERQIYIHDPKALHHIFVKDQYVFDEGIFFLAGNKAMFGDGLLSTLGHHHKKQRKMLNPVFSTANMRTMTSQFFNISYKLRDVFVRKTAGGAQEIDVMGWMTRTALEIISQSGLGTSFDPISEDHVEHPYITSIKLLVPVARTVMAFRMYVMPIVYKYKLGTPRIQRFLLSMTPLKALHKLRDMSDVMHNTSLEVFNSAKQKAMSGEDVGDSKANHKDLLTILMQENAKASDEDKLPDSEVLAQISTFMFAGMDTTSSAVARIIWLLATHQDVQDKLRAEIREAKRTYEEPDYDQLSGLPYLDAVCRESLRLYGPVSTIAREARKDAVLPLSKPIKTVDGEYIQEIHVPKGTVVLASLRASNTAQELWGPDSYEWKPERWLSPLPEKVIEAHIPGIYSHLMTFIGGGRACIGFKFSQMEMKVLLYVLIDQFKFSLPKQEIFWTMPGIASPCIDRTKLRPEMPMLVSRAAN